MGGWGGAGYREYPYDLLARCYQISGKQNGSTTFPRSGRALSCGSQRAESVMNRHVRELPLAVSILNHSPC